MNKALFLAQTALLLCSFLPFGAINHLDLIQTMSGEFDGSQFGFWIIDMDYNGDGYDDLIVHSLYWNPTGVYDNMQSWGKVYFYWGGPGFDNVADFVVTGSYNWEFSSSNFFNGGDINGDGIDDLVMTRRSPLYEAHIAVYYGSPNPTGIPDFTINSSSTDEHIYARFLGDINGDGHAELVILTENPFTGIVKASIWIGNDHPLYEIVSTTNSSVGLRCSGVGDVDDDGYADYVLQYGIPGGTNANNRIVLYYGSPNFPQVDSLVITNNTNEVLGSSGGCPVGDLNNDGYADFTTYNGRIWYGGENITSTPNLAINYDTEYHQWASLTYNSSPNLIYGDLNNDGYDDVIASNAYINYYDGEVGIWVGGPNMNGGCDLYLHPPTDYGTCHYGWSRATGDFNGDGICDLAVSAPMYYAAPQWAEGRVYVYSGNPQLVANADLIEPVDVPLQWQIDVFPNPFVHGGNLNIDFVGTGYKNLSQLRVEIYNLKGQRVQSGEANNLDSTYVVPRDILAGLSSGLYFISVLDNNTPLFKKKLCVLK